MSRIGRRPIPIPKGVEVQGEGDRVTVKGPRGSLSRSFPPDISIALEGDQLVVRRPSDDPKHRALHGLGRSLLNNMVIGGSQGFGKAWAKSGGGGGDRGRGGRAAAQLRAVRPPDPYKGKGIRYSGERLRLKPGKAGKAAK